MSPTSLAGAATLPGRHGAPAAGVGAAGAQDGARAPRPVLAVVGAAGAVGTSVLSVLATRDDVWGEVRLVGRRSAGSTMTVLGREVTVVEMTADAFEGVDVAVFAVPAEVSAHWAPPVAARGTVVVDVSSAFHDDPDVPLVAPNINAKRVTARPRGIVAMPGCTSMAVLDALAALHARWGLTSLVVTACLAASVAGRSGVERLHDETGVVALSRTLGRRSGDLRAALGSALPQRTPFEAPLALNVVPSFGAPAGGGWLREEAAVRRDLRRSLVEAEDLPVSVTCLVVPVVVTHTVVVHATFQRDVDIAQARQAIVEAPSVVLVDEDADGGDAGETFTPADAAGCDPAWAGRVRQADDGPASLDMVLCSDNLRGGSALTAVRVAELVAAGLPAAEGASPVGAR